MNFRWNFVPPTPEVTEAASDLSKAVGISPILCRLLIERGITSKTEVKKKHKIQIRIKKNK